MFDHIVRPAAHTSTKQARFGVIACRGAIRQLMLATGRHTGQVTRTLSALNHRHHCHLVPCLPLHSTYHTVGQYAICWRSAKAMLLPTQYSAAQPRHGPIVQCCHTIQCCPTSSWPHLGSIIQPAAQPRHGPIVPVMTPSWLHHPACCPSSSLLPDLVVSQLGRHEHCCATAAPLVA